MNEIVTNSTISAQQNTKYTIAVISAITVVAAAAGIIIYKTQYGKQDKTKDETKDTQVEHKDTTHTTRVQEMQRNMQKLKELGDAQSKAYMSNGVLKDAKEQYLNDEHMLEHSGHEYMREFVQYYIDVFYNAQTKAHMTSKDAKEIRESMLTLAKFSVDEFAMYNMKMQEDTEQNEDVMLPVNTVRQIIAGCTLRFEAMHDHVAWLQQQGIKLTTESLANVQQHAKSVLAKYKQSPEVLLSFDLAMLYLVRAAYIDELPGDPKYEKVQQRAYDYVLSALTQVINAPCNLLVSNLRASQQKQTCLHKFALHSYTIGVMINMLLKPHDINVARINNDMVMRLGNISMLSLLSGTNYTFDLFTSLALEGRKDAQEYINNLIISGQQLTDDGVYNALHSHSSKVMSRDLTSEEKVRASHELQAAALGKALAKANNNKYTEKAVAVLNGFMSLSAEELKTARNNINDMTVAQTAKVQAVLNEAWKFEHDILQAYIECYNLDPEQIHENDKFCEEINTMFCRQLQSFNADDLKISEQILTAQKLVLSADYNDKRYKAGKILELFDADNKKGKVYSTDHNEVVKYALVTQNSQIMLQLTTECFNSMMHLFDKKATDDI